MASIFTSSTKFIFVDGSAGIVSQFDDSIDDAEVTIETLNSTSLVISLHWNKTTLVTDARNR